MGDIRQAIPLMKEPEKSITVLLIEFYETMKGLEKDPDRGGKQATKIVLTLSDFKTLIQREKKSVLEIAQKLVERSELQDKLIKAQAEQIDTVKELVTSVKSLFGMS